MPLPQMFDTWAYRTTVTNNILKQDSILSHMVTDIPKIGQISADHQLAVSVLQLELKDDTFALLKKNVKITKERIPLPLHFSP